MSGACFVLTDSGGIQEETSFLGVPCLTLRENTERPSTISHGTNTLIGRDFALGLRLTAGILAGTYKKGEEIRGWDGHACGTRCRRDLRVPRYSPMLYRRFLKPLSDRLLAAAGLIALSPVVLALAILIRRRMGSPVVFRRTPALASTTARSVS